MWAGKGSLWLMSCFSVGDEMGEWVWTEGGREKGEEVENGLLIHKLRKSQSTVICNQSFLTSLAQKRSKLSRFYLSISLDFF